MKLKDPKDWKIVGKPLKRLDTADKVTGKQVYGFDLKLPGMLNAAIKDCPVFGGKVKSFDAAKVVGMNGVKKVVPVGDSAVAVVADTWWQAKTALDALPIEWDDGPNAKVSSATIAAMLKEGLDAEQAFVGNQNGDAKAALAGAAKKIEAVYAYPFQNHAPMEPMNATARYTPERCEVWVPTQNGEASFARARGLRPAGRQVRGLQDQPRRRLRPARRVPGLRDPGGADRQGDARHAGEAALVARGGHAARPLPPGHAGEAGRRPRREGNLDRAAHALSGQSILAAVRPQIVEQQKAATRWPSRASPSGEHAFGYTIPNLLIDHAMRNPHVPPGFWRGVNINQNAIFIECFMDELAQAAGRTRSSSGARTWPALPRNLGVLNAVAERIGWGKPAPSGVHRGLAQMKAFNSYVAAACEISVSDGNKVKVHRIVAATDPGYAVNPAQIERQVAGSFVYGLSAPVHAGVHGQGRRASSRRTSTTTRRCASRRCRRSRRSSCRPAARSGAASASRRSASPRRRC